MKYLSICLVILFLIVVFSWMVLGSQANRWKKVPLEGLFYRIDEQTHYKKKSNN